MNICLTLLTNAMDQWRTNTIQIFKYLLKGRETSDMAETLDISLRAVNKNIASHHLKDHAALIRALSEEMGKRLVVGSGIEV